MNRSRVNLVMPQTLKLSTPQQRKVPILFSSPHSGCEYPKAFLGMSALDAHSIRSSEDSFVDDLFEAAPSMGTYLLTSIIPRAYVDLNRGKDELDPALFRELKSMSRHSNHRIESGLGVIPVS